MTNVRSAALTHPGYQRSKNEDFITFFEPTDPEVIEKSGSIYILADGVGGASKGEKASQYAAQKILHDYYKYIEMPIEDRLRIIIQQAGNDIYDYALSQDNFMQMATTVVVAVVCNSMLQVAHVGDSRAYLIHAGQVTQLTQDHSTVGEMMRDGLLTEEEAMHFDGRNPLSRSLGGQRDVRVDVTQPVEFMPGDKVLLSSDGFTRYASRENINDLLNQGKPDDVVYRMIDFANQSGGADNISVIIAEAVDKDAALAASKGQQPIPVDWDTIPTLPQNFVYRDRTHRKKTTYARKKPTIIPFIIAGLGAVILILAGLLFGETLLEYLSSDTPEDGEQAVLIETQPNPDFLATNQAPTNDGLVSIAPNDENPYPVSTFTEDVILVEVEKTQEPTIETLPDSTETPTPNPEIDPQTTGWCTYTIDFNGLDVDCKDHIGSQCPWFPSNPDTHENMDLFCLIKCKFPDQFSQWDVVNIQEDCDQYADRIDKLDTGFQGGTNRTLFHGWTLRFPEITYSDCYSAGGEFELDE